MSLRKKKSLKIAGMVVAVPFGAYAFWFALTVIVSVMLAITAVIILLPWFLNKVEQSERLHQLPAYYELDSTVLLIEGKGPLIVSGGGPLYEQIHIKDDETGTVTELVFLGVTVMRWDCCTHLDQAEFPALSRYTFRGILKKATHEETGLSVNQNLSSPQYNEFFDFAGNQIQHGEGDFVSDLRLVSKQPMYFDQHVAITCGNYRSASSRPYRTCSFESLPPETQSDWPEIHLSASLSYDQAGEPLWPPGTKLVDHPDAWPQFISKIEQYIRNTRVSDDDWQTVKARAVSQAEITATD